jgi:hypothetical protein
MFCFVSDMTEPAPKLDERYELHTGSDFSVERNYGSINPDTRRPSGGGGEPSTMRDSLDHQGILIQVN